MTTRLTLFVLLALLHSWSPAQGADSRAAVELPVQVTEEGQRVVFDRYTWQRRELAKRLPLDQRWPSDADLNGVLSKYGLDKASVPEAMPTPARILPDLYLVPVLDRKSVV